MGEERRRHPRYRADFQVAIASSDPSTSGFSDTAKLHDISNSGLSFISGQQARYSADQRLLVRVLPPEDASDCGISVQARATVVWIRPAQRRSDEVQIGIRLDEWIEARDVVEPSDHPVRPGSA